MYILSLRKRSDKGVEEMMIAEDFLKLISDKVDLWSGSITKDEGQNFKIRKSSIYQEVTIILNVLSM